MMSSKMPGGFNVGTVKNYLETRWGLGQQRQKAVLLVAIVVQPASRLTTSEEAKAFFDVATSAYALEAKIDLTPKVSSSNQGGGSGQHLIDPAALEEFTNDQKKFSLRQLQSLAAYLKMDLLAPERALLKSQSAQEGRQAQLDLWNTEHGDFYANAIHPIFNVLQARRYDSCFNWVRDDILQIYYTTLRSKIDPRESNFATAKHRIASKAGPRAMDLLNHLLHRPTVDPGEDHLLAGHVTRELFDSCNQALSLEPTFQGSFVPLAPQTIVDAKGAVRYSEVSRLSEGTVLEYCQNMSQRVDDFEKTYDCHTSSLNRHYDTVGNPIVVPNIPPRNSYAGIYSKFAEQATPPEDDRDSISAESPTGDILLPRPPPLPLLHLKQLKGESWEYSAQNTRVYLAALNSAARSGVTFRDRTVLVTGSGVGSIGAALLESLLEGGATVITTTSRFSHEATTFYRNLYTVHGSRGSRLIVVPFNQSSKQDVENLIDYIYRAEKGLGLDLDHVVPFAAISEGDMEIDGIDSKSELAHRMMLTNVIRLLGCIKKQKSFRGYLTRPTQVILPLSPNHGNFGGDGLYSESKIALETLFRKWGSERWSSYLTVCGASVGWTRGTGLMSANNIIAEHVERLGVRTFSQDEMAFNIMGLMTSPVMHLCEMAPTFADLSGALNSLEDLKSVTTQLRKDISEQSETRKLLAREQARETKVVYGDRRPLDHGSFQIEPQPNLDVPFPQLPDFKAEIAPLGSALKDMMNLDKVVVVTGFSELGPLGNSKTRWEVEAHGKLSLEGCIELAQMMSLIKYHNGPMKGREGYFSGWTDRETSEPLSDREIKPKFEKRILDHTGIRVVNPLNGRDNRAMQEIVIQEDLLPFETSKENAINFQKQHGDKAEVFPVPGTDEYQVRIKAGANVIVPRAIPYEHFVAGQMPGGWDPLNYGVSEDIVNQVDRNTLYTLVCTAEALINTGVTDPYEFYEHAHVSEIANCIGSGLGGGDALRSMYRDRALDKPVQSDILQETFINTVGAWVNMLLLSTSGPIKTPVGACATALESVNVGYDTIVGGQARICFVGGSDVYQEEVAAEFGNMKATNDPHKDAARGRVPKDMSRPNTSSRSGFIESEGAGIQILTTAKVALEMGLPIHGIVSLASTATDKIGRSVPAPGQGILVNAREGYHAPGSSCIKSDLAYRDEQRQLQLAKINDWEQSSVQSIAKSLSVPAAEAKGLHDPVRDMHCQYQKVSQQANQLRREAQTSWGNDFYKRDGTDVAPIRGALATWGLNIDDLGVASLHGTSTVGNDKNESDILCKQMQHLGRSPGNPLLAITQKYLTGHPKGAAGAWMLNGALQVLDTGLVPGNRNLDNVDEKFEEFEFMHYPGRNIQTDGIKAVSVTSFGFGQKSAQVVVVHPRYLYATLEESDYEDYAMKLEKRHERAYRDFHRRFTTQTIFQAKEKPPYTAEAETETLLSPKARATKVHSHKTTTYSVSPPHLHPAVISAPLAPPHKPTPEQEGTHNQEQEAQYRAITEKLLNSPNVRAGVDIEDIPTFSTSRTFISRNFTDLEAAYCNSAANPQASFAGRWSAKEAVFKSFGVAGKGAGTGMREIEIARDERSGAPIVKVCTCPSLSPVISGDKIQTIWDQLLFAFQRKPSSGLFVLPKAS